MKIWSLLIIALLTLSCSEKKKDVPVIGFLDLLEDETLKQARIGFLDALRAEGFDENNKTIKIIYRNAQGDQMALGQACDYFISENVSLIATNPTLSTITAIQKTNTIPVFMMVSPHPKLMKLTDSIGNSPENLFGVYETINYVDTSIMLIKKVLPSAKKIGTIYNQSEPQSIDALNQAKNTCARNGMEMISMPVNNSNEAQLVVQSLLSNDIDAFFALPDNIVFSSLEVIINSCDEKNVPVFTSEQGLVKRGALAAFGADMYMWGYQAGQQAALFLKQNSTAGLSPSIVKTRRRVYNSEKAQQFNISFDSTFTAVE